MERDDGPIVVSEHGAYLDLAGRRFGLVDVMPPADDPVAQALEERGKRWSGWDDRGWGFTVPMENGCMIDVRWDYEDRLSMYLHAPYWAPDMMTTTGEGGPIHCWISVGVPGDEIRARSVIRVGGPRFALWLDRHLWADCDHEWAAEHIERVSRMPFVDHDFVRDLPRVRFEAVRPRPNRVSSAPQESKSQQPSPTTQPGATERQP